LVAYCLIEYIVKPYYVYQNDTHVLLQIELAGANPENVEVTLEKDGLHIKTNRTSPNAKLLIGERSSNSIHKTFQLDRYIDTDNVQAAIKEGILSLTFAKKKQRKSIQIHAA
jgi:HSP20 family protein